MKKPFLPGSGKEEARHVEKNDKEEGRRNEENAREKKGGYKRQLDQDVMTQQQSERAASKNPPIDPGLMAFVLNICPIPAK